jgi:hypothetical protein
VPAFSPHDLRHQRISLRHLANDKIFQDAKDAVSAAKANDQAKLRAALSKSNTENAATVRPAKEIGAKGCYIG